MTSAQVVETSVSVTTNSPSQDYTLIQMIILHRPIKKTLVLQVCLVSAQWVIPEKIHNSPTDGTLEILAGGGSRALEIQVGGGV